MTLKHARWAPTSYTWNYNPYKWPYKWVTGVITLLIGAITPFATRLGAHLVKDFHEFPAAFFNHPGIREWLPSKNLPMATLASRVLVDLGNSIGPQ